jgi:hypothetical protein
VPAPTVVVYKDAYANSGTSATTRVLTQRTVATGDVVALVWQQENWVSSGSNGVSSPTLAQSAGTAVIGAITKQRDPGTASHTNNALFTFTVTTGGTLTLTVGWTNFPTLAANRNTAWTFVATGCGGVGNTAMTTTSATTITASLTTSANSYVIAMAGDWGANGGATTTLTPSGGVLDAHETDGVVDQVAAGVVMSSRGGHWADTGAPATVSYGVTVPTSSSYNLVVCELKGTSAAGLIPQQLRRRSQPSFSGNLAGATYGR